MKISFSPPDITDVEIAEVVDTLKSGWITTGPKTKLFEQRIAAYCGTTRSVCLNSQTACAELTLHLLGVGPGDEVITTAYTYTASASVICHVGATPVLIDTAPGSYEMNYDALEAAITEKTKVIIPVDIGGVPCDYNRIFEIVERKRMLFCPKNALQKSFGRIIVSADAAHSFGAKRNSVKTGALADFTSFSFHAVKNLTTGEGGAVTWREIDGVDSTMLYSQYMLLSLHGQSKDAFAKAQLGEWEYDIAAPYFKCNMTDIMAALGLAQLMRYPEMLNTREQIIKSYNEALCDCDVTIPRHYTKDYFSSGHLYLVNLLGKTERERNQVITRMAEAGVSCNVHYKPLPMHSGYKRLGFRIEDFPNAYALYQNEITLPLHTLLTDEQIGYVCNTIKLILNTLGH